MKFKKGLMYVFGANIINLIISLVTGFVLPKILSIETYSNIKLFQLYITYIGILHLGFSDGMYLRIGGKELKTLDKNEILAEFKTFKVFQLFVSIVAIIISIILKNEILLFCSMVILPINIGNYLRNLYQAIGEFKRYSNFTNINAIIVFIVNLILLFLIKTDYYIIYIVAYIIAYIIYWMLIEFETKKIFGFNKVNAKREYLVNDVKDGFFLMIGNFCNVIFTSIDRIFVQNLLGTIKFAFYSFAVSIENLMNVFITPISTVMYNYLCNNQQKEEIIKIKRIILVFSTFVVICIFPAKFIINIWLTKYSESINVLFLLFAAQYISIIIRCVHTNLYKAKKMQNIYFIVMICVVVLSIILNIIFYNVFKSMESFAIATLMTNIIWFMIGEMKFKEYRLKVKDYIYTFVVLAVFLLCGEISNAIVGFVVYIISVLVLTILLMRKTLKYFIKEMKNVIKNKFKNEVED